MSWTVQQAQSDLRSILDRARADGPQVIRDDADSYIVLRQSEQPPAGNADGSFRAWLLTGPSLEGVDLVRDQSPLREVDI